MGLCAPVEGSGFPGGVSCPPSHARMRSLEAQPRRWPSTAVREARRRGASRQRVAVEELVGQREDGGGRSSSDAVAPLTDKGSHAE